MNVSDRDEDRDQHRAPGQSSSHQDYFPPRPRGGIGAKRLGYGHQPVSRILVTGGTGFIGRALCSMLLSRGFRVSVATRSPRVAETIGRIDVRAVPGVGPGVDWSAALRDVDAVVHLATRTPAQNGNANQQMTRDLRRVNVEGARKLAEDAATAGVRRLIYISSAGIHGATTMPEQTFRETDPPAPADMNTQLKWEAEQALSEVAETSALELFVLRPPLVYGPRVKGDFLELLRRLEKARLLPIAGPRGGHFTRCSLLYVENLCDAIVCCLTTAGVAGGAFLVRDGEDLTPGDVLRTLVHSMGRDVRVVQVPRPVFPIAARIAGNGHALDCVATPFCINDSAIRQQLGWTPPHTVVEGFDATVAWFTSFSP